jgi:hypothetical protein
MLMPSYFVNRMVGTAALASLLCLAGCGSHPEARYVPAADTARQSLEAALAAWKNNAPQGAIQLEKTSITVIDSRWRAGRKLENFEILEELTANPHRIFRVKLRLAKAPKDEETNYLVIGIDPLLVYRSEDYEQERKAF